MAYVKNKELKTRIALKYDSYANWHSNNPVLLAGEIAIATVETNDQNQSFTNLPNTVIKVGNGSAHYNDLPFLSALAADVHSWAKAAVKPSYAANEITGLKEYVEGISDIDTDTQYRIMPVTVEGKDVAYQYKLQSKPLNSETWTDVADNGLIDLSDANTRLTTVENILANAGLGGANGKDVATMIAEAIAGLDGSPSQTAGADGLALSVTQVDGVVTGISGSIAVNTYDAYGAAKAVQGETTHTVAEAYALADAAQTADEVAAAVKVEEDARKAAIEALDYNGYVAGNAAGDTISFVGEISETNGIISATKRDLKFQTAYDPENNKAATMSDVTSAVADLNGAMHFEGVSTTDPVNAGVTIAGKDNYVAAAGDVVIYINADDVPVEYVYDGSEWHQLGNESIAQKAIENLDVTDISVGAAYTLSTIGESNGLIHATPVKIQIAEDQVTGLVADLAAKATNADLTAANQKITALEEVVKDITGVEGDGEVVSVSKQITDAINNLDKADAAVDGKYVSAVSQENGVITVTRADLPTIPDVEVAQGAVTSESGEVAVVTGIEVDTNNKHKLNVTRATAITADGVDAKIQALDATITATAGSVLTGITETDGVLTGKTEVALADVAFSGNVKDLVQTEETYVLFNCGTSSDVIDAQ